MKIGFYRKLALEGMGKNKRMYLPYTLTCVGMVMMAYIINYLKSAKTIAALPGGYTIQIILNFGTFILSFFSVVFLFYTNSFLIRRRKKEFGLYNILGMGKRDIGVILFWESIFVALFSIGVGLLCGITFSKLAELGLVNILKGRVSYTLSVSAEGVIFTAILFGIIFLLLFLNGLRQVWFSNAISLLHSENVGEKPPKANWLLGILGFILLGAAYYLALTIEDPITALSIFFIAVIMVIGATYLIMVTGSVLFCRILQKKKNYYYKPNHFVSISSMAFRMKRNGAGLASICILATMVLVMIASTSALFIGGEDVIRSRYPRELNCELSFSSVEEMSGGNIRTIRDEMENVLKNHNAQAENVIDYRAVGIVGLLNGGDVIFSGDEFNYSGMGAYSDLFQIYFVSVEDYNAMTGENAVLAPDEVLAYANRGKFKGDTFGFQNGVHYTVKEHLAEGLPSGDMALQVTPSLMVIMPDLNTAVEGLTGQPGNGLISCKWNYCFDTSLDHDGDISLQNDLSGLFGKLQTEGEGQFQAQIENREVQTADFYSVYGGIFYLGIILSIVFILAAVLIIYYKQISEGYEDQSRFEIMQKIGMTKKDIRKSINSQLLTVFFLPLLGAGLHLAFAFPMIEKMLLLFNLNNHRLFISTTIGSFLVYSLFYVIVYRVTSNAYYEIVSGAK